jgi:hypothetical protein
VERRSELVALIYNDLQNTSLAAERSGGRRRRGAEMFYPFQARIFWELFAWEKER